MRIFASDAAVGAYSPELGVFARGGRYAGALLRGALGVFARAGLAEALLVPMRERARMVDDADAVDCPLCCGFSGFAAGGERVDAPAEAGFEDDKVRDDFDGVDGTDSAFLALGGAGCLGRLSVTGAGGSEAAGISGSGSGAGAGAGGGVSG